MNVDKVICYKVNWDRFQNEYRNEINEILNSILR